MLHLLIPSLVVPQDVSLDRLIISERDRLYYNRLVKLLSILFNPITLMALFLLYKSYITNDLIIHEPVERISSIPYIKILFYVCCSHLTLWYNSYISFTQYLLLWFAIPSDFLVMYFIYTHNINFEGFRYFLFLFLLLSCFLQFISKIVETFNISAETIILERMRLSVGIPSQNSQTLWTAFEPSSVSTVRSLTAASRMNMQQLQSHKDNLLQELKDIKQEIKKKKGQTSMNRVNRTSVASASTNRTTTMNTTTSTSTSQYFNIYSGSKDLQSDTCCICLSNPPSYQFKPCYHCCVCEECVLNQYPNTTYLEKDNASEGEEQDDGFDVATSLDTDEYLDFNEGNIFLNHPPKYIPRGAFAKCPVCKMPATELEMYHYVNKCHLMKNRNTTTSNNETYHFHGVQRGNVETQLLVRYCKNNPEILKKLSREALEQMKILLEIYDMLSQ
ncbi:hypothetical protein C9374_012368 [Naegleria lovaniensis]|uniref:Uncharacterized protein n=1 Tax=Naegleria lovaniensis TaxID=51637 RepID=A0AA88KBS0_NAELO|nr:uncharacterized protein C9374_012368 [Naegleria lovaniensis]KAG2373265.1 hypothetical protein C9374_012368 [Naegleria lovaniensis]